MKQQFQSINDLDSLEFVAYKNSIAPSAIEQLKTFPLAQFKDQHQLLPNFLWMDPTYLSGLLQPNYKMEAVVKLSTQIQAELALNWHYYFLVNTNLKLYNAYRDTNKFAGAWVKYANLHPEIPVAVISFWVQVQPFKVGGNCIAKTAYAYNKQQPDCCYVHDAKGEIISKKYASPLTPLELLQCDFATQSMYVDSLLHVMKRPIQMINDNGEVFRVYEDDFLAQDAHISAEKNKFSDLSWNEFQAMKRLEKEMAFKNSFMLKTPLAKCLYSVYAIDGQNEYRHDYKIIRSVNSKINNQYYATPDFYPRYPYNWKDWEGPWHGLKWLEISRKTEIELGDHLFSPFVAAGWDSVETKNIRPAQWLGLLKITAALGAEFYYTGFFNTGKAIAKPENYVWQAAMPIYSQAVTSFYEDMLRNSIILNNDQLIQYPNTSVPVVIRKHNTKNEYLIACSWQTGSNYNKNVGLDKEVEVDLGYKKIKVKARRQGSVYFYSEEKDKTIFYQIDGWHEYMHPCYWNKNILLEAELYGNDKITEAYADNDFTHFTAAALLNKQINIPFEFRSASKKIKKITFWLKNEESTNAIFVKIDNKPIGKLAIKKENNYIKYVFEIDEKNNIISDGKHYLTLEAEKNGLLLDKIEIEKN